MQDGVSTQSAATDGNFFLPASLFDKLPIRLIAVPDGVGVTIISVVHAFRLVLQGFNWCCESPATAFSYFFRARPMACSHWSPGLSTWILTCSSLMHRFDV